MSNKVSVMIELSAEERDRLATQAHQRGYDSVGEYLVALAISEADDSDLSKAQILENMTTGMKEALHGETHPIETRWDEP